MDSSKFKALLIVVIALFGAIYLGVAAATAQKVAVMWVAGILFLATCMLLGRHIWIIIPATLGMKGGINLLPGAPEPWHLMTLVVASFFAIRIAVRRQRLAFRWTSLDFGVALVALSILQAFVRNPTGLMVFGGDTAGGKPYFIYAVAILAFVLIGMADADQRSFRWAILLHIVVTSFDGLLSLASGFSPAFAEAVLPYYSNVSMDAVSSINYDSDVTEVRLTQFSQLGSILGLVACSFWRPVAALDLRKPWRGLIAITGVAAALLSGFRGNVSSLFFRFVVGSLVRGKPWDVVVILLAGFIAIAGVIAIAPVSRLPYSVQRILTVIPGAPVRDDIAREAQDSIDLRVEMWERALLTDRYIDNKILGDGFGIKKDDAALITLWSQGDRQIRAQVHVEEVLMAIGAYHGFHAEVIRFTGVVGLICATTTMIIFFKVSSQQIKAHKDGEIFGYVIFLGIPFLIMPFWYWFVYGDYRQMFPPALAMAGMLKLLLAMKSDRERTPLTSTDQPPTQDRLVKRNG